MKLRSFAGGGGGEGGGGGIIGGGYGCVSGIGGGGDCALLVATVAAAAEEIVLGVLCPRVKVTGEPPATVPLVTSPPNVSLSVHVWSCSSRL